MFGKMVLPMLGGAPTVWNTCMIFFQAALLAGYSYAHATDAWLGVRRQAALHMGLLLLPLLTLPIAVPMGWSPPVQENPIRWLLALLLIAMGLPFFVVSASAPMLQKWFANTGHPDAKDPYFLYGASNLGSMGALLSYPLLMEPNLRLAEQSWMWSVGYGLLVVLMLTCAVVLWRGPVIRENPSLGTTDASQNLLSINDSRSTLTLGRRLRWVALSFVPSSLMLGLTTYLTTDIASVPLLWVIPLAIYLLTFILVFARKRTLSHKLMVWLLPILISPLVASMVFNMAGPMWLLILLHLLTFFVAAMVCHGELAKDRPPTQHLTEFYLWIAIGGVLGGLFNALVAPTIFKAVVEYPLAIVLTCLLRPPTNPGERKPISRWLDFGLPLLLGVLVTSLALGLQAAGIQATWLILGLVLGVPIVICYSFRGQPIRFGLGIGAIMLSSTFFTEVQERWLYTERSFFGIHRVKIDQDKKYRSLVHGTTLHGMQSLDPTRSKEPLTYYYPTGPIGSVFTAIREEFARSHIAIIGLGAGSLACYGAPGQYWTFYEIDPAVERIARRYFTFLRDCPPRTNVVLGDARLSLEKAPDLHYSLIVLDAFSSDSIPVHLLTRQAIQLYLTKLADGGILAFHISNRSLNLQPVVGHLARDFGLFGLVRKDREITEAEARRGKAASDWIVMASKKEDLGNLSQDSRWELLSGFGGTAWTDDFSNILSVLKWQR